jgi:hypothetical protein
MDTNRAPTEVPFICASSQVYHKSSKTPWFCISTPEHVLWPSRALQSRYERHVYHIEIS